MPFRNWSRSASDRLKDDQWPAEEGRHEILAFPDEVTLQSNPGLAGRLQSNYGYRARNANKPHLREFSPAVIVMTGGTMIIIVIGTGVRCSASAREPIIGTMTTMISGIQILAPAGKDLRLPAATRRTGAVA